MRFNKKLTILPAFFIFTAWALAQDVHYNYERGANFASYKTYTWVVKDSASSTTPAQAPTKTDGQSPLPVPPAPPANPGDLLSKIGSTEPAGNGIPFAARTGSGDPMVDQEVRRAVDEQLAQKGLARTDGTADLIVVYHVALREERAINLTGFGWESSGGYRDGSVQGQTSSIAVGTLVIDLYDSARKQLIWRGDVTKTVELKRDPNKNYKTLQKAMTKLFKNYPPPPSK